MKKILFAILAVAATAALFSSCKKEESKPIDGDKLLGTWQSASTGYTVQFNLLGTYVMYAPSLKMPETGKYEVISTTQLTMLADRAGATKQTVTYAVGANGKLTLNGGGFSNTEFVKNEDVRFDLLGEWVNASEGMSVTFKADNKFIFISAQEDANETGTYKVISTTQIEMLVDGDGAEKVTVDYEITGLGADAKLKITDVKDKELTLNFSRPAVN